MFAITLIGTDATPRVMAWIRFSPGISGTLVAKVPFCTVTGRRDPFVTSVTALIAGFLTVPDTGMKSALVCVGGGASAICCGSIRTPGASRVQAMVTPAIVPTMELPCADFRQRFNSLDVRFAPRKLSRPQNRVLRRDVISSSILTNAPGQSRSSARKSFSIKARLGTLPRVENLRHSRRSLFCPLLKTCAISSVVEHLLHTQGVAGSIPASRTRFFVSQQGK